MDDASSGTERLNKYKKMLDSDKQKKNNIREGEHEMSRKVASAGQSLPWVLRSLLRVLQAIPGLSKVRSPGCTLNFDPFINK